MYVTTKPVPWRELSSDPRSVIIEIADGDLVVSGPLQATDGTPLWPPRRHQIFCRDLVNLDLKANDLFVHKQELLIRCGNLSYLTGRANAIWIKLCRLAYGT